MFTATKETLKQRGERRRWVFRGMDPFLSSVSFGENGEKPRRVTQTRVQKGKGKEAVDLSLRHTRGESA